MSGIIGVWNLDGRPIEKALLARLSSTLAHRGPDGEGIWIDGPVGFACQLLRVTPESLAESQPLVHSSGTVVVFDGRLDNRDEILRLLGNSPAIAANSPDPALVLALYERFGQKFPEHLNGDFALGLFDPKQRRLILVRDSIGVRPLYYYRTGKAFVFASEIKAILAHPDVTRRPNDDMLAAYLVGDGAQHSHGMTFFDGVSSLIPGHMAIVTTKGFMTRRYWAFDPERRIRFGSFQEHAEAFRERFEEAVRRRLRSAYPVAVAVSGGLDSSSILCLAETLRRRAPDRYPPLLGISLTSRDGSPSDEKSFLLDIERAYDIEIKRIPRGPLEFLKGSREALRHIEAPALRMPCNTPFMFHDIVHQQGARVLLTGLFGDQMLANREYLIDLFRHLRWRRVWVELNEYGRWFTEIEPSFFRQDFLRQLVRYHVPDVLLPFLRALRAKLVRSKLTHPIYSEALRHRIHVCSSRKTQLQRPFTTAYASSICQLARSWYYVQCMEWNNKVASINRLETAYPFLDRDLISFLLGIPGEMQTWKGVPKALLREAMKGILPDTIRERRWKAMTTDLLNETMEKQYPQLVHCLQSDGMALKLGFVKGDVMMRELTRLKHQIRDSEGEVTSSLGDLLGLELWLQVFFGQ